MLCGLLPRPGRGRWAALRYSHSPSRALEDNVFKYLSKECGVKPGSRLLLCVSGGSDSICLLHVLMAVRARFAPPISAEVVHFNHKLRPESNEEADFVRAVASGYGIPFHLREWAAEPLSKGMHAATRRWRREEALQIAGPGPPPGAAPPALICTAHQREDQTETLLLKLLRGAHLSRLQLMHPRDGPFIKPFLSHEKKKLVDYLCARGLEWREDLSNAEKKYQRNRIRLDLVPLMAELAGGENALYRRCAALSTQSDELRRWIDVELARGDGFRGEEKGILLLKTGSESNELYFHDLPTMVQGKIIHDFILTGTNVKPDFPTVRRVLDLARTFERKYQGGENTGVGNSAAAQPHFGVLINKRVSISDEWEIKRERWTLVIKKRLSRK